MERLRGAANTAASKIPSSAPRRQPSNYPFPITYVITFFVFASASVVTGILGYFIYYLHMDKMSTPYQFIILISVSSITLVSLIFSTHTHVFGTSTPQLSLIINAALLVAWLVGLGLITSKVSHMVITHSCTTPMWINDDGMMVCRLYKALYAFIIIGTAAVAAAAILDLSVMREASRRGVYREMKDGKPGPGPEKKRGLGLGRSMSGMAARRSGFGLRGGNYVEMKESPSLGGVDDEGDMAQRLVGRSPDLRSPDLRSDYQSPDLSEYEKTPKL